MEGQEGGLLELDYYVTPCYMLRVFKFVHCLICG